MSEKVDFLKEIRETVRVNNKAPDWDDKFINVIINKMNNVELLELLEQTTERLSGD